MTLRLAPRPQPTEPARFVRPVPIVERHGPLQVVGVDVPDAGMADVRLLWPRGWAHERTVGACELTSRLLGTATSELDRFQFASATEALGAHVGSHLQAEASILGVDVVAERLPDALELLLDALTAPDVATAAVDRARAEALDHRRRLLADPSELGHEAFVGRVHAGTPHGRGRSGSSDALRAVTDKDVALQVAALATTAPTLVVTGDLATLELAAVAAQVTARLAPAFTADADLGVRHTTPNGRAPAEEGGRGVVLVHRPGAVQSVLLLGHAAPSRHDPDHAATDLGIAVLGGAFHSRLNLRLREDCGITYGARAHHAARRGGGAIMVRTAVQADATAQALHEIDQVVAQLVASGPTDEELDDTRSWLLRRTPQHYETVRVTADTVATALGLGIGPDQLGLLDEQRARTTTAEVTAALQRHLHRDAFTTVVVGDADRLARELDDGAYGPLEVVRTPQA